jgi:hypothetical protein
MDYTITKETINVFSQYITSLVNFNMGFLGGTTNIQMIFDLVPRCLKHVWCYRSHIDPYEGFQVLNVVDINLVNNVLHTTPVEKFSGVKSGDVGGQAIGPPLPIHLPAIYLSR